MTPEERLAYDNAQRKIVGQALTMSLLSYDIKRLLDGQKQLYPELVKTELSEV